MQVLVDTSIWSLAMRRSRPTRRREVAELTALIADHRARIIGPIRQELLSGIRHEDQFERLMTRMAAFPDYPLLEVDYVNAARFYNTCRAAGVQGSGTDFLICAVAERAGMAIFTTDADFHQFATHLPIQLHSMA